MSDELVERLRQDAREASATVGFYKERGQRAHAELLAATAQNFNEAAARIEALEAENAKMREADQWQPIETAPKDGRWILVWEVVVCDEEDEDGLVVARNQRFERQIIVQWVDMFACFVEPRGNARPVNGTWNLWRPLPAPPSDGV